MKKFIEGADREPLVTTLKPKLESLEDVHDQTAHQLLTEATELVSTEVIPGYEAMIALFESMLPQATHDAGIWRLPNGEAIYAANLRSNTTTNAHPRTFTLPGWRK